MKKPECPARCRVAGITLIAIAAYACMVATPVVGSLHLDARPVLAAAGTS